VLEHAARPNRFGAGKPMGARHGPRGLEGGVTMGDSSDRVVDLAARVRMKASVAQQLDNFYALHEAHHVSPRPRDPLGDLSTVECYTCNEFFQFNHDDEKGGQA
jgi:hypothetical protein